MSKYTGIWVDHSRAFVASIGEGGEELAELKSGVVEEGRSGAAHVSRDRNTETRSAKRRRQLLTRFYGEILSRVRESKCVLLLGPGVAKQELLNIFRSQHDFAAKLCGVKPAEKMTGQELVRTVRNYFALRPVIYH